MEFKPEDIYSAIGLTVDNRKVQFALAQSGRAGKQHVIIDDGSSRTDTQYDDFYAAMKAYNEAFRPYLIGKRVHLVNLVDTYPLGLFRPGITGTVVSIDGYIIAVKLDEHRSELDEWDNELHWSEEGMSDADGREWPTIEAFLRDVEFLDGDVAEFPGL